MYICREREREMYIALNTRTRLILTALPTWGRVGNIVIIIIVIIIRIIASNNSNNSNNNNSNNSNTNNNNNNNNNNSVYAARIYTPPPINVCSVCLK